MRFTTRKAISLFLIAINAGILVFVIGIYVSNPVSQVNVNATTSPRIFQIPFGIYLSPAPPVYSARDVSLALTFTYPNGSLYVGDHVSVSGIAVLNTEAASNITGLYIGFENSLHAPPIPDQNGILQPATLELTPTPDNQSILKGSTMVEWPSEGSYHIIVNYAVRVNQTTSEIESLGESQSVLIQVYPNTQAIAQQEAQVGNQINRLTLYLTIALIVLTIAGAITNANDLFSKEHTSSPRPVQSSQNEGGDKAQPSKAQNQDAGSVMAEDYPKKDS